MTSAASSLDYLQAHLLEEGADCVPGACPEFAHLRLRLALLQQYPLLYQKVKHSLDVVVRTHHQLIQLSRIPLFCIAEKQFQQIQPQICKQLELICIAVTPLFIHSREVVYKDVAEVVHSEDRQMLQARVLICGCVIIAVLGFSLSNRGALLKDYSFVERPQSVEGLGVKEL